MAEDGDYGDGGDGCDPALSRPHAPAPTPFLEPGGQSLDHVVFFSFLHPLSVACCTVSAAPRPWEESGGGVDSGSDGDGVDRAPADRDASGAGVVCVTWRARRVSACRLRISRGPAAERTDPPPDPFPPRYESANALAFFHD